MQECIYGRGGHVFGHATKASNGQVRNASCRVGGFYGTLFGFVSCWYNSGLVCCRDNVMVWCRDACAQLHRRQCKVQVQRRLVAGLGMHNAHGTLNICVCIQIAETS